MRWEGGARRGEGMLEWVHGRVKRWWCVCGGGYLQLTGNLFLPLSQNKGRDWLRCVRTGLLHALN